MLVIIPFGYLYLMLCMHLCYDAATIYCFVVDFALTLIYCHGSYRYLIDDYSVATHDRYIVRIIEVPYIMAVFGVSGVACPSAIE